MESFVSIIAWSFLLGALLLLPALLFFCLRLQARKKTACLASLLCAVVIIVGAAWLAFHPIRRCPKELEPYMTEDRWQEILSVTGPIYSRHLPFFPWRVTVERADAAELYWKVNWFPAGTTRTGITADGYDPVHGLR